MRCRCSRVCRLYRSEGILQSLVDSVCAIVILHVQMLVGSICARVNEGCRDSGFVPRSH